MTPKKNTKTNFVTGTDKLPAKKKKSSSSKNNFRNDDVKKEVKYKLWVVYKPEFASKYPNNPMTYYGYNKKAENGLKGLMRLAAAKKPEFKFARIYDLVTNEIFLTIQGIIINQVKTKADDQS